MRAMLRLFLLMALLAPSLYAEHAFEGFGALAKGGAGGPVIQVTTLEDHDKEGSLRWAVSQSGPREVRFQVDGVIRLKKPLRIGNPFITIDGRDAKTAGITLRDYPVEIENTHDIVIRNLRVRLGDWAVLKRVDEKGWKRHQGSGGLDCINIDRSENVMIDHVSAFWSTDELISVTNSKNVTVQWCLLAEPISNPKAHPYGDNHAYCANNSASTLTYHHCLFAHYVMRGPQFEANDMDKENPYDANFEAVNNIMFGYTQAGSKYRTGFEKADRDRIESVSFNYHFIGNRYINQNAEAAEIEADDKFGIEKNIRVYWKDNVGSDGSTDPLTLAFTDAKGENSIAKNEAGMRQVSAKPLFQSPVPVTVESVEAAYESILASVGCSHVRDEHDARVIEDVKNRAKARIVKSQADVGGWETWKKKK